MESLRALKPQFLQWSPSTTRFEPQNNHILLILGTEFPSHWWHWLVGPGQPKGAECCERAKAAEILTEVVVFPTPPFLICNCNNPSQSQSLPNQRCSTLNRHDPLGLLFDVLLNAICSTVGTVRGLIPSQYGIQGISEFNV